MAFVGFAVTNPLAVMSMLDVGRWRSIVWADTPRTLGRYAKFINSPKQDQRKNVLFVFGATNLHKVLKDQESFFSILVFDDMQNLHQLRTNVHDFEIVDVAPQPNGGSLPKHLTPAEVALVVERSGVPAIQPLLLTQLTAALGKRRPSVLETTSRMPMPEAVPESGAQRLLLEMKHVLETTKEMTVVSFPIALDVFLRFLFRMIPRSNVTTTVTKKLPTEAKDIWQEALTFADSDIGLSMARAYQKLCKNKDVDYRIGHAVSDFGLKPYSGDFIYFTSILPPHRGADFLDELQKKEKDAKPTIPKFKAPPPPPQGKKKAAKKARSRW
jgi:hypothetical protein